MTKLTLNIMCLTFIAGLASAPLLTRQVTFEVQCEQARRSGLQCYGASPLQDLVENTCQLVAAGLERALPPQVVDKLRGKLCSPYDLLALHVYKLRAREESSLSTNHQDLVRN